MIIYIVPKVIEIYKGQYEFAIDEKIIKFFKFVFPKSKIEILTHHKKLNNKNTLLVLSGGNTILKFSKKKKDKIREKLDNFYFNQCIKKKIKILGICHGAHFIADHYNCKIKKKKHLKNHEVYLSKLKKKIIVNSYHNYIIYDLPKNITLLGNANDKTIEAFEIKSNILGIMWHPERYKKFKKIDKKLINSLCN